ncbi:ribose-phosphate pyrophosphokinase [Janthinobacterium sp. CG_23.3]|uniref:ribose-phosphate diphosphokinase n=1 Tax=unclassified Janthinobacterium TaxID=2610881 RepID=UPI00034A53A5|nr:ribose-phosphate diphosphokinase [Janthinobacterium sp. CG_S6]MEC5162670.1 ribose-phosphate pyrophosphokinase [Janthinobacterium sp. CG_S6]
MMFDHELQLFVLNSSRVFGEQVARWLDLAPSPHDERDFEDGEHKARPLASVRGNDVFVLLSLYGDAGQSANDKLCRLLFFIGAVKDAGAARVTAVVPYLAYARKDRKSKPCDPVTTRYVAALFEAVGTDAVLTLDVHNLSAYQNAFRCCTEHLEANRLFVKYFAPLLREREVVAVSPDAGSIKRTERFRLLLAEVLDKPVCAAIVEKYRSGGVVSGDLLVGDVKGKDAVIVDDLISTGNTLARSARACRNAGASRVFAAATHGLFAGDANAVLADGALERIVVSDSVPAFRLEPGAAQAKLTILSCTALFAEAIERMHNGGSVRDCLTS